jgi:hypothetical protein
MVQLALCVDVPTVAGKANLRPPVADPIDDHTTRILTMTNEDIK